MREGDPARVSVVELHGDQVPIILQVQQPCPGHTGQGVAPLKSEGRQMGPSQPGWRHSNWTTPWWGCSGHYSLQAPTSVLSVVSEARLRRQPGPAAREKAEGCAPGTLPSSDLTDLGVW